MAAELMSERDSAVAGAPGSLLLGRGRFVGVGAHLRKSAPRLLLNQPGQSWISMRKCANMAIGTRTRMDTRILSRRVAVLLNGKHFLTLSPRR